MYFCSEMKKNRKIKKKLFRLPRNHKVTISLNDEEYKAVCKYLSKYKIINRSKWMRETVMISIFRHFSEDYPTLFSETEMQGKSEG